MDPELDQNDDDPSNLDPESDPETGDDEGEGDPEADAASNDGEGDGDDTGEVTVSLGEEPAGDDETTVEDDEAGLVEGLAPAQVSAFIKMRQAKQAAKREARELRERLAAVEAGGKPNADAAIVVGDEPQIEDEKYDYDTVAWKKAWTEWNARKAAAAEQERKRTEAATAGQEAWKKVVDGYDKAKKALKVPDFDQAEAIARDALSPVQQGILLQALDKPELMVYALGRSPKRLKEVAAITDAVKFTAAIAKLETQMKVTPRKQAPTPERVVRGNVPGASAVDNTLDRLRAEAVKTGDLTKVMQHKATLRSKRAA